MEIWINIITQALLYFLIAIIIFNLSLKIYDGKNILIDSFIKLLNSITNNLFKCYEYIRQRICKKGNKVDDDRGTVLDNTELYDSSSEWQD